MLIIVYYKDHNSFEEQKSPLYFPPFSHQAPTFFFEIFQTPLSSKNFLVTPNLQTKFF